MVGLLRPMTALFISAALVLCGSGLETILLPFRADIEGFSRVQIGLIGSSYWIGITAGCLVCPVIIGRVGHPRAYTVFTGLATVSPLLEAMWQAPVFWWLMRALTGACFAGILTVIESWINSAAPNSQRGRILSAYTITNFGVIMVGQQLLNAADPAGFKLFSLGAILFSLSGLPLALTLTPAPPKPRQLKPRPLWLWKLSPAAFLGAAGAGLANSAFWGLGPLYAKSTGMPASAVALFMTTAVLGGTLAQWPLGKWSDNTDRRNVLLTVTVAASAVGAGLYLTPGAETPVKLALAFLYGVCALPVYWISVAHANDHATAAETVDVSSNLLLIFAASAIAGPLFASGLATLLDASAIFLYTAAIHVALGAAVFVRIRMRDPVPAEDRDAYVLIPDKSSPSVFELDPRGTAPAPPDPAPRLRLISSSEPLSRAKGDGNGVRD